MSSYVLSLDQGTTSSRAVLINDKGEWCASFQVELRQIYPRPLWVEHDPLEIWDSICKSIQGVLNLSKIKASQIVSIGITNQRETVLLWERKSRKTIGNAIVWQDRRTSDVCNQLKKKNLEKTIRVKTGLLLDPYFSASKLQWIFSQLSGAEKKSSLAAGTVDSWLLWKLTGGKSHATDVSNASRTMLFNINELKWDKDLLKIFKIPIEVLPDVLESNAIFGVTEGLDFLPDGIPITGILGDQQAALFGQNAFTVGEAKCTYGTGSFLLMNCGTQPKLSKSRLLSTVSWQLRGEKAHYALEGSVFICGAAVQWLRDGLGLISHSSEIESLALQVPDNGGVVFVPSLAGLGAPYWQADAKGLITGLTRGTQKGHIARASLEAMALQNVEILRCMEKDSGKKLKSIKVDGGATKNNLLMQMQSDYLGVSVIRPKIVESTVIGAAYMAGLGVGIWKSKEEINRIWQQDHIFKPQIKNQARLSKMKEWNKAMKQVCL